MRTFTTTRRLTTSIAGRVALAVVGGALALSATACGPLSSSPKSDKGAPQGAGGLGGAPSAPSGAGGETAPVGGEASAKPPAKPSPTPTKGGHPTQGGHPTAKAPTGMSIVYFKIIRKPTCRNGDQEGQSLIVGWKTTGAHAVALSADNPGMVGSYGTYPGNEGTEEFVFSCAVPGSTETHTYTIHTVDPDDASAIQRSKTLNVSLKVPSA